MRVLATGLFLIFLAFCLKSSAKVPETVPALLDSLELLMKRQHIPGLMLTLVKDDSVIYQGGLGYKDLKDSLRADEETLFRLGSITKSFVALGVLKLVKEGKFSLEDEVKKIAPEVAFENPYEPAHPVRVKHLLSHTAGFDDMHFRELYNTSEEAVFPLDKVIALSPQTLRVRWQPGTRFAYSNPGWTIAGYLIEKFSEQPYDAYIMSEILRPIGMEASNFNSVPEGPQYARGYKGRGEEVPFLPIYHRPAGAFNSNAREMALWLKFLLSKGDTLPVFSPADIAFAEQPLYTLANRAGLPVGYGLGNYTYDSSFPVQFHGHDGGIDGFVSSYGYNREHGIAYAISNNGTQGVGQLVNLLKNFLTRNMEKRVPAPVVLDKEQMRQFEGLYVFKASRNQLFSFLDRLLGSCQVEIENDTLRLKYFAKPAFPVFPVENKSGDGYLFRAKDEVFPSHVFFQADGKNLMATGGVGNYLEQTASSGIYIKRGLFFSSIALLLSAVMGALVWLIFAIRKSISWAEFARRVVPAVAAVAIFFIVLGMVNSLSNLANAGQINSDNLGIYLGSWVVLFCALFAVRFGIMNFKTGKGMAFSIYYIFLAASTVVMALFLYDAGWMGLKLWEY